MPDETESISPRGYFINRDDDSRICIVQSVNDTFANLSFPTLGSTYPMPILEYNERFGVDWRPARLSELARLFDTTGFVAPTTIPEDWADYS